MNEKLFQDFADAGEEAAFREWVRQNWKVGDTINPTWHPVVRDEIKKMIAEKRDALKLVLQTASADDAYRQLRDAFVILENTRELLETLLTCQLPYWAYKRSKDIKEEIDRFIPNN